MKTLSLCMPNSTGGLKCLLSRPYRHLKKQALNMLLAGCRTLLRSLAMYSSTSDRHLLYKILILTRKSSKNNPYILNLLRKKVQKSGAARSWSRKLCDGSSSTYKPLEQQSIAQQPVLKREMKPQHFSAPNPRVQALRFRV